MQQDFKQEKPRGRKGYLRDLIPGILFCTVLGLGALFLDSLLPPGIPAINYVLIAIFAGFLLKNLVLDKLDQGGILKPGIDFSARFFLIAGVVLIGSRMDLGEIMLIGGNALLMVALAISISIALGGWLGKKGSGQRGGHLLGIGMGICGISAIMAAAPVLRAREKEVFLAVGTVMVADIIMLLGLPFLAGFLGWGDEFTGYLAGTVTANTAQAVAVGHACSIAAGSIATITKSARNVLLPVAIGLMAYYYVVRGLPTGEKLEWGILWKRFPKFVLGFLFFSLLTTLGVFSPAALDIFNLSTRIFFAICFAGLGAGLNISMMEKKDLFTVFSGLGILLTLFLFAFLWIRLVLGLN